ncbi:hypothetical protein ABZ622_31410 [Streptomyces sp. NPDC007164]|uniref:hypothetical protein n=1 Tax=Streptomyces sp. NPDC007164 TaxID=3156918 RepID=UPI0033DC3E2F
MVEAIARFQRAARSVIQYGVRSSTLISITDMCGGMVNRFCGVGLLDRDEILQLEPVERVQPAGNLQRLLALLSRIPLDRLDRGLPRCGHLGFAPCASFVVRAGPADIDTQPTTLE